MSGRPVRPVGVTGEYAWLVAGLEQARDDEAADAARAAEHEDAAHRIVSAALAGC